VFADESAVSIRARLCGGMAQSAGIEARCASRRVCSDMRRPWTRHVGKFDLQSRIGWKRMCLLESAKCIDDNLHMIA
jgi:hypothetical protein